MEKYSPNWLLDKLNNSKTDAHKLMHIIDFQNNVGLHNVSVSLFNEALKTLRDLAEHQNGAPLIRHEEEYNKTMTEVWDFLEANET